MKKYFSMADFFIAITVCVISVGIIIIFGANVKTGTDIVIEVNGKVYASYNMQTIKSPREIHIKTEFGENTLLIDDEGAKMIYSNCHGQNDVKQGKIHKPGQTIVCAPHKLVVYINGETDVDAITL